LHDAAQVLMHEAPPHEPLHEASQVGQPGQVHAVGQVHCSPYTVPFSFRTGVVLKLSISRSSSCSLNFFMASSSGKVGSPMGAEAQMPPPRTASPSQ
jgi:hypothetical protein